MIAYILAALVFLLFGSFLDKSQSFRASTQLSSVRADFKVDGPKELVTGSSLAFLFRPCFRCHQVLVIRSFCHLPFRLEGFLWSQAHTPGSACDASATRCVVYFRDGCRGGYRDQLETCPRECVGCQKH